MTEWFERSFQEDYLKIYAHRDEQKAIQELEQLLPFLNMRKGQQVLDLCCGQGRHSRWLAHQGVRVIGVDLSAVLLQEAIRNSLNLPVLYMRADARQIPFENEMDLVVNLFTSFGYFEEDEENEKVIQQASRALKPEGMFLFDYLNPLYVKENIEPFTETKLDGMEILQYRTINESYVKKRIVIQEPGESQRHYEERVKLYNQEVLTQMLERNDFKVIHQFGNYDASDYQTHTSPRMIFICQKQ